MSAKINTSSGALCYEKVLRMRRRISHSHRRPTSSNLWFRMDVPRDVRELAGVTSWQKSLETADPAIADVRRASYSAHYKAEVIRLRAILKEQIARNADQLVGCALSRMAAYFGSMDVAVSSELTKIATIVRSSWSNDHARAAEKQHDGEALTGFYEEEGDAILAIDGDDERQRFRLRAELLEGRAPLTDGTSTDGLAYQALAASLLVRGNLEDIRFAVSYLPHLVPEIDLSTRDKYSAVATAYISCLTAHRFTSWPEGAPELFGPAAPLPNTAAPLPAPLPVSPPISHTLADAFELWKQGKNISGPNKAADEFATALSRFEELCKTSTLSMITTEMVEFFLQEVARLPSRAKRDVARLPLAEQMRIAAENDLPTLQPPTVGKHLAAVRRMLAVAKRRQWITHNPAAEVEVEGAKWQGNERDHFSDHDMQLIYGSTLMTDPSACSDTMFWILFMAPFHGSRPGEHCKLKPNDIVEEEGEWVMRFRRDKRVRSIGKTPAVAPRRQKTRSSIRDIPLHWIVLEGGFLSLVDDQRRRGEEWLFDDLRVDAYGDRYRLLSAEINRALRRLGITESDKAFYSTRHTMKREGRRRRIAKQSLDQLAGHASGDAGDKYGQGLPIDILKQDIDQLEFRSVDWDPVVACARERVRRRLGR